MTCLRPCIGLLLLLVSHFAMASGKPLAILQASGHLQISSALTPHDNIVPGQKVQLMITVATDRWFSGGTKINIPEVPGLIILQTEQFASNASETRDGKTWVLQNWSLDVYPQRAGDFTIPPIKLDLSVNTEQQGDISGNVLAPETALTAQVPAALSDIDHWVAAPSFEVHQDFDRPREALAVGEAIEREILFRATDVMAMMLPDFSAETLPGLAAYPSPPVLQNDINRGEANATRRISISYIAETPGRYVLPAREYFWWNTSSAELQLLTLPEVRIEVTGASGTGHDDKRELNINPRQALLALVIVMVSAVLLRLAWAVLPRLPVAKGLQALSALAKRARALGKPALPERLNPGSSAGD